MTTPVTTTSFTVMPIFMMILLGLVVLGLCLLPRKGKIALGVCVVLLMVVGFFGFATIRMQPMTSNATIVTQVPPIEERMPASIEMSADEDHGQIAIRGGSGTSFTLKGSEATASISAEAPPIAAGVDGRLTESMEADADVYPSVRSAAIAHSKALFRNLDDILPNGEQLTQLEVVSNISNADVNDVVRSIKPFIGQANIRVSSWTEQQPEGATPSAGVLTLRITQSGNVHSREASSGVQLVLAGGSQNRSKQVLARVENVPWLEHLDAYRQERMDGHEAFVVDSGMEKDSGTAVVKANRDAAKTLLPQVLTAIQTNYPEVSVHRQTQSSWLRKIEQDLARGRMVADKFTQQINKPYGPVYRQFLLVDASDDRMRDVVDNYARDLEGRQTNARNWFFSAAGLVLIICLMYLFLNAATKGYYAWSLRLLGAVVLAAGIVFLIRVA